MAVHARTRLRTKLVATVMTTRHVRGGRRFPKTMSVAHAADAAPTHYTLDPAKSTRISSSRKAGALNEGQIHQVHSDTGLVAAEDSLATSKLDVVVDMASLDTGDKEAR